MIRSLIKSFAKLDEAAGAAVALRPTSVFFFVSFATFYDTFLGGSV